MYTDRSMPSTILGRSLLTLWHLPRMLFVGIVRLYQMGISPYFPSTCRYTPTCSQYAIQSLKEFGAIRGTILATWRILRCNPWGGHGHDPPRWFGQTTDVETVTDES